MGGPKRGVASYTLKNISAKKCDERKFQKKSTQKSLQDHGRGMGCRGKRRSTNHLLMGTKWNEKN